MEAWLRLLHDGGSRTKARAPTTVQGYMNRIRPLLLEWSARYDHLREVTRDDIVTALNDLHGDQRHHTMSALRSLFARAKKNGAIFRNPTPGIKTGQRPRAVFQPLHDTTIKQAVQAATTPAERVMVALAAVHAARPAAILALQLDEVDLATGGSASPVAAGHWTN